MCVTAVSEEMHEIALIVCLTFIFLISFFARFAFFLSMVLSNVSRYSLHPSLLFNLGHYNNNETVVVMSVSLCLSHFQCTLRMERYTVCIDTDIKQLLHVTEMTVHSAYTV